MFSFDNLQIHKLKLIEYGGLYVYAPEDYDTNLLIDLRVALAKYYSGYKSFNYVRKKLFDSNPNLQMISENKNPYDVLLKKVIKDIQGIYNDIYERFYELKLNQETNKTLCLVSAFSRLKNSYKCALFLINSHNYFESIAICRLIFEQLSYCFNLLDLDEDDFKFKSLNQLRNKLKPTDINKLKNFMPNGELGQFYSYLSEIAHIDYKRIGNYLSFGNESDGFLITNKSIIQTVESALVLLKIIDMHSILFEYAFKDYADLTFKYLINKTGKFEFNPKRLLKKLIPEYNDEFEKLNKEVKLSQKISNHWKNDNDELPF